MSTVAIIPARGGSSRVPRKNIREMGGDPIVGIASQQGLSADNIDRTIVNTDDAEIKSVAEEYGAETMDRPERFTQDNTTQEVDRLLQWCVEQLEAEGAKIQEIVLLYPTSPLRTVATIDRAVSMVSEEDYDSVLSLHESTEYIWKIDGETAEPVNYDPKLRGPTQKEDWNQWVENLAVYVMDRDLLMETGCRLGGKIGFVEMPEWRSIDIDTFADLGIARYLAENPPEDIEK